MRQRGVRLSWLTRLGWKVHRWVYRASRGRIGSTFLGWRVILLRTRGRKTGAPRQVALNALVDRGRFVVVGSYAGEPRHPSWYLNLQAQPQAHLLIRGQWVGVSALDAAGDERDRLWAEVVRKDPSYAEYQRRTSRRIPVVLLIPDRQPAPNAAGADRI